MSIHKERSSYKWFKRLLPKEAHICRIENIAGTGMPDVNMCFFGKEFWLEFKAPIEPKKMTTPLFGSNHKLLRSQINWIFEREKAGGKTYIIIETDKRWMVISGKYGDFLNKMSLEDLIKYSIYHNIGRPRNKAIFLAMIKDCEDNNA